MNSVFANPGIYSCAVDAFLEICTHLFLPYLSSLRIRNDFKDLLFNVCSHLIYVFKRRQFIIEGNSRACLVIHYRRLWFIFC